MIFKDFCVPHSLFTLAGFPCKSAWQHKNVTVGHFKCGPWEKMKTGENETEWQSSTELESINESTNGGSVIDCWTGAMQQPPEVNLVAHIQWNPADSEILQHSWLTQFCVTECESSDETCDRLISQLLKIMWQNAWQNCCVIQSHVLMDPFTFKQFDSSFWAKPKMQESLTSEVNDPSNAFFARKYHCRIAGRCPGTVVCWQTSLWTQFVRPPWQVHTTQEELASQCHCSQTKVWEATSQLWRHPNSLHSQFQTDQVDD